MTPVYHLPKWKFLLYLFTVPGMFSRFRRGHFPIWNTFYRACSWLDFLRHYKPSKKWVILWIGDSEILPFYIAYEDPDTGLFTRVLSIRHFEAEPSIYQDTYNLVVFKYHDETIYKI